MSEGCTEERRQHGTITIEAGDVSKGGRPLNYHNVDPNHCYLDWLKNNGHLGNREDSSVRYDSGIALRAAHYDTRQSAPGFNPYPGNGWQGHVTDEDTEKDIAELRYQKIMKALPIKYRVLAVSVCVYDTYHHESIYPAIREMLDALYGALSRHGKNS